MASGETIETYYMGSIEIEKVLKEPGKYTKIVGISLVVEISAPPGRRYRERGWRVHATQHTGQPKTLVCSQ